MSIFSWLHLKDKLNSQCNFFSTVCVIFVHSTLLDMQIIQGVASHCIMSIDEIANIVEYNNKK